MRSLAEFIAFTVAAAPYTSENYPELGRVEGEDAFKFMLSHSFEHIGKVRGRIDTMLESYGHGNINAFNRSSLKELAAKGVFNALRFAALMELTPQDIEDHFRKEFKPKP